MPIPGDARRPDGGDRPHARAGWWLLAVALLCPWQVYLPGALGSVSLLQLSLAPLLALLAVESMVRHDLPVIPRHWPYRLLALLAVGCLAGVLWSPDPGQAIRTAVKIGGILVVASATLAAPRGAIRAAGSVLVVWAASLGALLVIFRFYPIVETGFLFSRFAWFTVDPDILLGLRDGSARANVLASERAGGVFTNANVAALFLGLVLVLGYAARIPRKLWLTALPFGVAGILATGSKAGLLAMVVTAGIALAAALRRRVTLPRLAAAWVGGLAAAAGLVVVTLQADLLDVGAQAGGSRLQIWGTALPLLSQHPLLGLGFGGWEEWTAENFRYVGITERYPPQNLILIAWAWLGLAGAFLATGFAFTVLAEPWRAMRKGAARPRSPVDVRDGGTFLALGLLFLWFVIQSMATNAAFTDIRIGVPLGVALGLLGRGGGTAHT